MPRPVTAQKIEPHLMCNIGQIETLPDLEGDFRACGQYGEDSEYFLTARLASMLNRVSLYLVALLP